MSEFLRYAVYYLPDDKALASFGARWLGWDVEQGRTVEPFPIDGLEQATSTPRKYGFHGTLKPPFQLAEGTSARQLQKELSVLASALAPVEIPELRLSQLGKFLALTPEGDTAQLAELAFECVTHLDGYRRAASPEELARRRAVGLTPRQDALLLRWGYPYVAEEFRFHLTLTGRLDPDAMDVMRSAAEAYLPDLPSPFQIGSIALVGEAADGMIHEIHRYTLAG